MGYKEDKEAFVSHATGGTVSRINAVSLVAVTSYALWTVAHRRWLANLSKSDPAVPLVEFTLLVLPLVLSLTLLSAHPYLVNFALTLVASLWSRLPERESLTPPLSPTFSKKGPDRDDDDKRRWPAAPQPFARPFVTSYRAIMMVMTVLCILAVDFPAFPREFAKAESWGTSLMDLGVGSFVFSLGLVAALPFLRQAALPRTAATSTLKSYWASLARTARKTVPLVALGLVRVVMVKGVDYPEHVTEYGVHWNFFFTLALLPVFGEAVARVAVARGWDVHAAGLGVALLHEVLLRTTGLQSWALEAPRTGLVSQNKEGLTSFPGYLAIYLVGLATGLYVLPPSPSFFRLHALPPSASSLSPSTTASSSAAEDRRLADKRAKAADPHRVRDGKRAEWLSSAAVCFWAAFGLVRLATPGGVSRRLANAPYVLWTAAFNTSFLVLYLAVHHLGGSAAARAPTTASSLSPSAAARAASPPRDGAVLPPPRLFSAINKNGLAVFLVANLLTGLCNVSLSTLYASDALALGVVTGYAACVCAVAWLLRGTRVKLG
ncbi:hypothetical protein JCM9279_006635 [Rhodotorula babjevae]